MVVHYTHLAVAVMPQLGATSGVIMDHPCSVDARIPVQPWAKFKAEPIIFAQHKHSAKKSASGLRLT